MPLNKTTLEHRLMTLPRIDPAAEHEVDLLRLILQGKAGTSAQRAMLIRVIKQNRSKSRGWSSRLAQKLGNVAGSEEHRNRNTYILPCDPLRKRVRMDKQERNRIKRQKQRIETDSANLELAQDLGISPNDWNMILHMHPHVRWTRANLASQYQQILIQRNLDQHRAAELNHREPAPPPLRNVGRNVNIARPPWAETAEDDPFATAPIRVGTRPDTMNMANLVNVTAQVEQDPNF